MDERSENIRTIDEELAKINGALMVAKAKAYDATIEVAAIREQVYRLEELRKQVLTKMTEEKK